MKIEALAMYLIFNEVPTLSSLFTP